VVSFSTQVAVLSINDEQSSKEEVNMEKFQYTVASNKAFEAAVHAIEQKAVEKGFRVLHTHDFAGTLAEKGFPREPLKVVEICNARYASEVLQRDINVALMLPCPISVFTRDGKTFISTMRPSALTQFYPDSGIADIAAAVEKTVLQIIDEAR
jgi:uncharacterized protein (DUF302 family)